MFGFAEVPDGTFWLADFDGDAAEARLQHVDRRGRLITRAQGIDWTADDIVYRPDGSLVYAAQNDGLLLFSGEMLAGQDRHEKSSSPEAYTRRHGLTSDHLLAYTRDVRARWDPMWGVFDDELMRRFHESLGDGLLSFLWGERDRRLVAKTPSVQHIDRFFTFFPRARLLILVRDGRSVVQSCMSTLGWDFDRAARSWAAAADEVRRFQGKERTENERYLLVRYEDLLDDLNGSLSDILRFAGLDQDAFDFEAAADLPVRGSSAYFGPGRTSVHWEPVPKGPDFDPRVRWRSWSPEMHERFEWIASKSGEQRGRCGRRGRRCRCWPPGRRRARTTPGSGPGRWRAAPPRRRASWS